MINPTWIETFEELHGATTTAELWGVLLSWHSIRSTSAWDEPYELFTRFHRDDAENAVVTAALLCTDHRWRKASHRLIQEICDSGLLDAGQVDELAELFLLDTFEIEVEVDAGPSAVGSPAADRAPRRRSGSQVKLPKKKTRASIVHRPIWPPLRRWAARHVVERTPARWHELLTDAETRPSRDATAVTAGVVDAANHIPTADRPTAVSLGLSSGSGIVRIAALPALAGLEGVDAALARAHADVSAMVRAWTPRTVNDPSAPSTPPPPTPKARGGKRNQLGLF